MTKRELALETLAHRNPGKVPQEIQIDVSYENLKALIDTAGEYWR